MYPDNLSSQIQDISNKQNLIGKKTLSQLTNPKPNKVNRSENTNITSTKAKIKNLKSFSGFIAGE